MLAEEAGGVFGVTGFNGIDDAGVISSGGLGFREAGGGDVGAKTANEEGFERRTEGTPRGAQSGLFGCTAEQFVKLYIESGEIFRGGSVFECRDVLTHGGNGRR